MTECEECGIPIQPMEGVPHLCTDCWLHWKSIEVTTCDSCHRQFPAQVLSQGYYLRRGVEQQIVVCKDCLHRVKGRKGFTLNQKTLSVRRDNYWTRVLENERIMPQLKKVARVYNPFFSPPKGDDGLYSFLIGRIVGIRKVQKQKANGGGAYDMQVISIESKAFLGDESTPRSFTFDISSNDIADTIQATFPVVPPQGGKPGMSYAGRWIGLLYLHLNDSGYHDPDVWGADSLEQLLTELNDSPNRIYKDHWKGQFDPWDGPFAWHSTLSQFLKERDKKNGTDEVPF